jgi:hypothetical protein
MSIFFFALFGARIALGITQLERKSPCNPDGKQVESRLCHLVVQNKQIWKDYGDKTDRCEGDVRLFEAT